MTSRFSLYLGVLVPLLAAPQVGSTQVVTFSSGFSYLIDDADSGAAAIPAGTGVRFRLLDDLDLGVSLGYDTSFENDRGTTWRVLSGVVEFPRLVFLRSNAYRPFVAACFGVGEATASGGPQSFLQPDKKDETFRAYLKGILAGVEIDLSRRLYTDLAVFYHHHFITREGLGYHGGAVQIMGVRVGVNLRLQALLEKDKDYSEH